MKGVLLFRRLLFDAFLILLDAIDIDLVILIKSKSFLLCIFWGVGQKIFRIVCELASYGTFDHG